jgi:prepilin-type N-terminal cleavage/methylation domain-containing protein
MTQQKRHAFTLVELLTVVAIITMLIGILVPAVNAARKQAAKAAAKAQIHGLSQGVEMFRTDFGYYPSSLPQDGDGVDAKTDRSDASTTDHLVNGAHRLAMAMIGRDQMGCPEKRGPAGSDYGTEDGANTSPDSMAAYYYSTNGGFSSINSTKVKSIAAGDPNWGNPTYKTPRRNLYIDPKGFNLIKDKVADTNGYAFVLTDRYDKQTQDIITTDEGFANHSVLLYYAANDRGKYLYYDTIDDDNQYNYYYYQDNARILLAGATTGGGTQFQYKDTTGGYNVTNFYSYIEDTNATINKTHLPKMRDSFILISRGYDGIYGTDDDVTNFSE